MSDDLLELPWVVLFWWTKSTEVYSLAPLIAESAIAKELLVVALDEVNPLTFIVYRKKVTVTSFAIWAVVGPEFLRHLTKGQVDVWCFAFTLFYFTLSSIHKLQVTSDFTPVCSKVKMKREKTNYITDTQSKVSVSCPLLFPRRRRNSSTHHW